MTVRSLFLLLAAATALAGRADAPRALVSRMLDVRENFAPPAKAMRLADDAGADGIEWPFNVWRIERMLERVLDRSEDGSYQLRREAEGTPLRDRADRALAYVNKVFSDWAVLELDAKFPRCDEATVRALADYRAGGDAAFWRKFAILTRKGAMGGGRDGLSGWVAGWKVADRVYLLLTSDLASPHRPRDYQFVMWDGSKDWPIAGFDEFPDAVRARAALRVLANPAAANNLAVFLHAREANRADYAPDYPLTLLRRAAADGCEAAFYNLGVLMEESGDAEQAAAFFSRGGAKKGD